MLVDMAFVQTLLSSPEHADRFRHSHNKGPTQVRLHQGNESKLVVVSTPISFVVLIFILLVGSSTKNGWLISLGNEE